MKQSEQMKRMQHEKWIKRHKRDVLLTAGILLLAVVFSLVLTRVAAPGDADNAVPLVFVLAVLMTARLTDGLACSMVASFISVFCVNFAFSYPYFEVDFTLTGYPITFIVMFAVSLVVSMLTQAVKRQERVEREAYTEKMKANLLRAVSHDLRTPLTSIIGASGAVLDNYNVFSDETKRDLIGHVQEDARWLMRLVENILSITRMNNEGVRIKKNPEAVEEIAAEAVGKLRKRFTDVHVRVRVPDELLMVPMDAILIEQVLINLMENAVLHGGYVTAIDLLVRKTENMAEFVVTDNGMGIDVDVLPKLFTELFPNAQDQQGDAKRSMGIGLSVCMSIVRAHGGDMTAENRPEGGARVAFTLPLEEE